MTDCVRRFLFEELDIRGAVVRLDAIWTQLLARRDYPPRVVQLLGEMSATTVLLADNLKQPGRLTIQLRGDGPLPLLVIDCSESLNLRAMAQVGETIGHDAPIAELLGHGQLLLSLDTQSMREPYQSIVPTTGDSIAAIFEHYLTQSEQVTSRFFLAASAQGAAGLFIQKMPTTDARDADGWRRIEALAATAAPEELLSLPAEPLLTRLFHEETVRLFSPTPVTHDWPMDWEKVRNILRTLGREDIYRALKENGVLVIRDDLANHEYRFDKAAIDELFGNVPETPPSVH